MAAQVPDDVATERLYRLQALIDLQQKTFNAQCVGQSFDVLFEKAAQRPGQMVGRSPYLQPIHVMAPSSIVGEIRRVTVTETHAYSLFGELASQPARAGELAEAGG
jgi:tRNA-2-methylthio-N6-dimethylallyladenosine synthase